MTSTQSARDGWMLALLSGALVVAYVASAFAAHAGPLDALAHGPDADTLLWLGARIDGAALAEPYRLLLAGFLHATPAHVASNVLWLLLVGILVLRIDPDRQLHVFVAFGLGLLGGHVAGALTTVGVSVGASGGVLGLLGLLLAVTIRERRTLPRGWLVVTLVGLLTLLAIGVPMAATAIDHVAHVAGWVLGVGAGLVPMRHIRAAALILAAVFVALAVSRGLVPPDDEPLSAALRGSRTAPGAPLPQLGRAGRLTEAGCVDTDAASAPDCQIRPTVMVAFTADRTTALELVPSLEGRLPRPDGCLATTDGADNVLVVDRGGVLAVLAVSRSYWQRAGALREAFSGDRCRGR